MGHGQIGDNQGNLVALLLVEFERLCAFAHTQNVVAHHFQQLGQGVAQGSIVINNQDRLTIVWRERIRCGGCTWAGTIFGWMGAGKLDRRGK